MLVSTKSLVLFGTATLLWILIRAIIPNQGYAVICMSLVLVAIQLLKMPQLCEEKIPENILSLFTFKSDQLKNNIIFHKGGGSHAPENSVEAIREAAAMGVKSVELDLDFTSDGVGVIIHGPKVDDTTDGHGFVNEFTFCDLSKLNAAAKVADLASYKNKYPTVRIPTLEACIEECLKLKLIIMIDCKGDTTKTANLVYQMFQKYPELYGNAVVCSFYPQIIYAVRQRDLSIITALTHRNHDLTLRGDGTERNDELWKRLVAPLGDAILTWAHSSVFWYICGNSLFLANKDQVSRDMKSFWNSLGVHVVAWTVNDPLEQKFFLNNLEIPIITDGLVQGGPVAVEPSTSKGKKSIF